MFAFFVSYSKFKHFLCNHFSLMMKQVQLRMALHRNNNYDNTVLIY